MGKLKHWTEASSDDFRYRIAFDYVRQIEQTLEATRMSRAELAKRLGVSAGRVSQILNNPGNLTLRNMVEYARALGRKISVIAYDDNDRVNSNGPISPEIFVLCWERAGKPADFFSVRETAETSRVLDAFYCATPSTFGDSEETAITTGTHEPVFAEVM